MSPTVGLIVPPAHGRVPGDGAALYGGSVRFIAAGLGLQRLSPEGYDEVVDKVEDLSQQLVSDGAEAISLMGTSLTFYRGWEFHDDLLARMRKAAGVPVTTMSAAMVEALDVLGLRHVAVATAYTDVVNERLRVFLEDAGLDLATIRGLSVVDTGAAQTVPEADVAALCRATVADASAEHGGVDGLFISCGGLETLSLLPRLEEEFGFPVVASSPVGFWSAVRLVGHSGVAPGHGRLFDQAVS